MHYVLTKRRLGRPIEWQVFSTLEEAADWLPLSYGQRNELKYHRFVYLPHDMTAEIAECYCGHPESHGARKRMRW